MKPTPRGFISGLFSDVLGRTLNMPSMPRTGIPSLDLLYANRNSLFNMAGVGDVQKTAERISYGQPLTTGSGMTLRPREEAINAAMTVAPFAPVVGRLASRAVRATEGMPVGMSIKSVGDDIFNLSKQEFLGKPRITKNANAADLKPIELTTLKDVEPQPFMGGKYQIKMNEDGAVVLDKGKPIASYNFGDTLVVDKPYRKSGLAQELVYEWRTTFPAPAVAEERTKASQAIQEKVWERIQNEKQSLPEQSPYPQQAALPTQYPLAPAGTRYEEFGGDLTYMTPDEFLQQVRPLQLDAESLDNIAALRSHVESGGKLDPLHIYASGKEDGRHRAYLAKELGIEKVPVALHGQTPTPIESPTFTDPFANTIGSSIR
jgi:hypothetical protein